MSNQAFDKLCHAMDVRNVAQTIRNMEAALPFAEGVTLEYIKRALPQERRRLEEIKASTNY